MFKGFDRAIWVRFWGMTLLNIGNFMIRPFLTLYLSSALGAGLGIIGLVLMVRPLGSFLGNMLGGYWADKIGRKPVMLLGIVFDGLCIGGYALTQDVVWFAVLSFLQGLSSSFAEPAMQAMIADVTTDENRSRAYSLFYMGANVGAAVGPLLAVGVILQHPQLLFSTMSALTVLFALVIGLLIPETKPAEIRCESDVCKQAQGKVGYGFVLKDVKLMLFLLGSFVITLGYQQMSSYMPLHLQQILPENVWLFGVMMSLNGILCVVLSMPMGNYLSRFSPYRVMMAGGGVYALGMAILALNESVVLMLVGYTVFTFGEVCTASVSKTLLADFAPADMRARYLSAGSISWISAATLAPILGGQLMKFGGGHVMLAVFTLIMGSSVIWYRLLWQKRLRELQAASTNPVMNHKIASAK
jgi:MFS family permease